MDRIICLIKNMIEYLRFNDNTYNIFLINLFTKILIIFVFKRFFFMLRNVLKGYQFQARYFLILILQI